jgi:hypothetical protein
MGLGATEMTEFLCPWSINWVAPVRGSQNWTPRSLEPDMTHWLSGVSATESTKSYRGIRLQSVEAVVEPWYLLDGPRMFSHIGFP